MLTAIPVNEMAETLRVLAGANAGNAARHFGKRSLDTDDVAAAIFWTNAAEILECAPLAAAVPSDAHAGPPVPRRMKQQLEATAFRDVRFDDVDADALIREALQETLAEEKETPAGEAHRIPDCPRALPQEVGEPGGAHPHEACRLLLAA